MAKNTIFILLFCSTMLVAFAQKTQEVKSSESTLRQAELLFDMKNYMGARTMLEPFLLKPNAFDDQRHSIITAKAQYYIAVCALELYQPDAEKLLKDIVTTSHETPYKRMAYYHLGRYYFRERKYKDAIEWYKKADTGDLDRDQTNEYNFQLAYCHFFNKEFKEALPLFKQSKDVSNKYYYPSNYYYGYILFMDGDYDKALASFNKIKESAIYQKIIPYYISEIYFHQKKYQETVDYLKPLVDDTEQKYYAELNQLIGEAYFELKQYAEALPHLEIYAAKGRSLKKEEAYQLGFCYYKAGQYDKAIERLQRLDNLEDTVGQNALFVLGDSYLKTNNKSNARAAFMKASRLDWDSTITESAGLQYAKLCYEQGLDNEAIRTLQNFIKSYPKSSNFQEASELLTDLFLNSKDYKQALEVIETIPEKSPRVKRAYQVIAYSRAVQQFNEGKFQEALHLLDVSLNNPIDPIYKALCYYWKGEAWYTLGDYQKANWQYPQFLTLATTTNVPEKEWLTITANYGNGYSYLKRKMYDEAASSLERSVNDANKSANAEVKSKILPDALLRLGDSYFMLKRYDKAVNYYSEVADKNAPGKEYAMYQKGFIQGLQSNNQGKITTMLQLVQLYPKGIYADDALFQAGAAYTESDNSAAAITTFSRLVKEYPTSPYVTKAYLRMGLIYYNQDNWAKANESYNKILDEFPNSEDAKQAFDGKKDIAIGSGNDGYIKDHQKMASSYMNASDAEKLSYDIAYNQFVGNNYEQAAQKFSDYLTGYNKGVKTLNAHYYRAQSYYATKAFDKALPDFQYVLDNKPNDFIEESSVKAAQIAYETKKDYQAANTYFMLLLGSATKKENLFIANLGLMRTFYLLGKVSDAATYANTILSSDQAVPAHIIEANFYLGKQAFATKEYIKAASYFKKTADATRNIMGAEANYRLCEMESIKGNHDAAIKMIYDKMDVFNNYMDWQAKAYILMGDNYAALGNYFQAKATLQSVIDAYTGGDETIMEDAKTKMENVKKTEESKSKFKIDSDTSSTLQEDPSLKLELTTPGNNPK